MSSSMPDWSYHTLFKPLLFKLPAAPAKKVILQAVTVLGTAPGGRLLLDFMGHMVPSPDIAVEFDAMRFTSRVGLGAGTSESKRDLKAFERFGFGFIEVGPVTVSAESASDQLERDEETESILACDIPTNSGLDDLIRTRLPAKPGLVPTFVRIAHREGTSFQTALEEVIIFADRLPPWIEAIVIDSRWVLNSGCAEDLDRYAAQWKQTGRRVFYSLCPGADAEQVEQCVKRVLSAGLAGISVTGGIVDPRTHRRLYGKPTGEAARQTVRRVRELAPQVLIIGSGGIIEPAHALEMLDAGADLITVFSGMVYSGPGLPKRINELHTLLNPPSAKRELSAPYSIPFVLRQGWLGIALVGFGLIITGASAITVALTTVVLPYDEIFLGITRYDIMSLNSNLLPFMSHDRVTYAGAGMSCGLLYAFLSGFGGRAGQHWAYMAALASCGVGFCSFLLFLGFRYLDPLHSLVCLILLPFFVWGVVKAPPMNPMRSSNSRNSSAWLNGLRGQFWFVCIGAGLILAGFTICAVGTSTVFVNEDLEFMRTTAKQLLCHNEHLLPTIAHDRAGFGGTLVSSGIAVLLTSLHGFRQGEGWVWWMLLISGLPGFLSTLGIHYAIGYTSFIHLLPAYIATIMFAGGLALSYRYLCVEPGPNEASRSRPTATDSSQEITTQL